MGKHWDVIERDGAHIRGVDDTDELVRRAGLFPMSGKRKVYIIDECHRLSAQSWDVMLKLLEEPPPFVVIILCTTEPDKVPVTIKSRCAICAFDMPTESDIQAKLEQICAELSFPIDRSRLLYCVSASKGNFRAAENLLEQAYAEYIVEQVEELSG